MTNDEWRTRSFIRHSGIRHFALVLLLLCCSAHGTYVPLSVAALHLMITTTAAKPRPGAVRAGPFLLAPLAALPSPSAMDVRTT
jgi:hypothetical protein